MALAGVGLPADATNRVVVEHELAGGGDPTREAVGRGPQVDEVERLGQRAPQRPVVERVGGSHGEVDVGLRPGGPVGPAPEDEREQDPVCAQDPPQRLEIDRELRTHEAKGR